MDVKVRLFAHVSTRDLDLQLFRRERRLCRYFLPFNYKQLSCPEGENIPSQLTAPTQYQSPSLRCPVYLGPGAGRPGSWLSPSRPRTWVTGSWCQLYHCLIPPARWVSLLPLPAAPNGAPIPKPAPVVRNPCPSLANPNTPCLLSSI